MIELTVNIKNKQSQINQQTTIINREQIGIELFKCIHSIENNTTLAGKITGMMLQWDINKIYNLLNNKKELLSMIKLARDALDSVPFRSNMELITASNLRVNDKLDFRNDNGKSIYSTVMSKTGSKLLIHFDGLYNNNNYLFDMEYDYNQQLHRFAVAGSISSRPGHRLQHLQIGDMVDINPWLACVMQIGWTCGKITDKDGKSGQVEVWSFFLFICCLTQCKDKYVINR